MFLPQPHGELQWFERQHGGVRAWLHPRVGPELSSTWLAAPPSLADAGPRASGVTADGAFFVKRRSGSPRRLLAAFARALELEEAGLPVPVHLAVLHDGRQTTLVTEALVGDDLDVRLPLLAPQTATALAHELGALVAALHGAGYRQRDLKAPNLLVSPEGALALLDLEGVRRSRKARHHLKDLARLRASFLALETRGLDSALFETAWSSYEALRASELPAAARARIETLALAKRDRNRRLELPLR